MVCVAALYLQAPVLAHAVSHPRTNWPWAVCQHVKRADRALRRPAGARPLRVLATGDSMIYPIHEVLTWLLHPSRTQVTVDRRDGTGLRTPTPNWPRLARRQAARYRPDVTVITLGGRDAGFPLATADHGSIPCCGLDWQQGYAARLRPLVLSYLRGGRGRVYWLSLPVPRDAGAAPLFAAVNGALRLLVGEFAGRMRLIPVEETISPGGFQDTLVYDGLTIHPRHPDGFHLTHEGGCVEGALVEDALRADGLLR